MAEVRVGPAEAGMVMLRGDLADGALVAAVEAAAGGMPGRLGMVGGLGRGAAWMSPDELLLLCPRDESAALAARLSAALEGTHHLVADVSDLRVAVRLDGPAGAVREVLGKLTPADLGDGAFGPGIVRRSRLGQVAAAFWLEGEGAVALTFRSVGDYLLALLRQSAADGPVGWH